MLHRTSLLLLLLPLLWAGVSASAEVELHKRIVGGRDCSESERDYHVILKSNSDGDSFCGGSLISSEWVITAAHCWETGMFPLDRQNPLHTTETSGMRIIPHNGHLNHIYLDNQGIKHDLMLLKVRGFGHIDPVDKPDCSLYEDMPGGWKNLSGKVQIAGHGATGPGPGQRKVCAFTPTLQCADMGIVRCGACVVNSEFSKGVRNEHSLCYQEPGVDTCPGDSGGGVVYNNMIYGVHVTSGEYVCDGPAIFMNLCHPQYAAWITRITNIPWPV
ncbi:uncharacterized protein V6R79_019278 [Siganus canaliculatus]